LLPKDERLAKGSEIKSTIRGNRINTPLLSIHTRDNPTGRKRMVVICKKSIGSAVIRNRTRRVIMAAYANIKHKIAKNIDIVIMPKAQFNNMKKAEGILSAGMVGANY